MGRAGTERSFPFQQGRKRPQLEPVDPGSGRSRSRAIGSGPACGLRESARVVRTRKGTTQGCCTPHPLLLYCTWLLFRYSERDLWKVRDNIFPCNLSRNRGVTMIDDSLIRFCCPHCGKEWQVKSEWAGKSVKCHDCSTVIVVPPPPPEQLSGGCGKPEERDEALASFTEYLSANRGNSRSTSAPDVSIRALMILTFTIVGVCVICFLIAIGVKGGNINAENTSEYLALFSLCLVFLVFYFLPGIIAGARHHHNAAAILVFNVFLGWTFLGWVLALVWAFTAVDDRLR